ncbi:non-ribosomal peptide synthetase [Ruegeria arenilitoris]|uniref:non-ribosomal peptide synthetase n=1 Tax=Ruegeria arenilitoris TaxID=1173585 RepID=UPI00147BD0D8|nr:non-ribosomal peptide synthetase [Ruegeria arenilitoris]
MHRLTESQKRFWRGHQLHPDVPLYNVAWRFDLRFEVKPNVFYQAFLETLQQNEILRTVFRDDGDGPFQIASEATMDLLEIGDLSSEADPNKVLEQTLPAWVQKAFDLGRATLRSKLVKLSDNHWVWTVCQHHIACDAQSGSVLFEQVSQRYKALTATGFSEVEPAPSYFESAVYRDAQTKSPPASTPNPSSPPYGSPAQRTSFSTRIRVPFTDINAEMLEAAIGQPEFRLFTPDLSRMALYLTAYFAYLHRVTGDEVITIGLPSHNRASDADRRSLGLFVEVLPFRIEIEPSDSLLTLHGKIKTELGEFLRQVRSCAASDRQDGGISAVCNFIQSRFGMFAGHPASIQWLHSGAHYAAHAIRFHITDFEGTGRADLFFDVHNEILHEVPAERLVSHFAKMLTATLSSANSKIPEVDLGGPRDDRAILYGPAEAPSPVRTILDAIEEQVKNTPEAVAIIDGSFSMTYAQVHKHSNQIAAHITHLGVDTGSRIAIHLPRSPEFVLAALGILKAGCCFIPIAANTPSARVERILTESKSAAVVTASDLPPVQTCQSITIDSITETSEAALPTVTRYDIAYVLFTSGSTGTPKGVAVDHGNFHRYIRWAGSTFSKDRPAHYPFFSSVSFDLTLTSLFVPLSTGGSITVYPERGEPDLAVLDVFNDDKVDIVKLTPSHLALVCAQNRPVRRIKTLVLGGENLTSRLCRSALDVLSTDLSIFNEYGPTEAVVGAMQHLFDREIDIEPSVQIGCPASGVSISVRDSALNICPFSVTGEIVIGGRLAQGYLNASSGMDHKFPDQSEDEQGRIYRTGDLGRIRRDGSVEYLGRTDEQIKLGGVRLEVAEFEHVLQKLPGVDSVHVAFEATKQPLQTRNCRRCGLPDNLPELEFPEPDLCAICEEYDTYKDRAQAYFKDESELGKLISRASQARTGDYDAIMLLSGGKDSTYAAYRLAEYTSRVLAVTLDNGYISEGAKANIQRITQDLGWLHRYLRTDKMNQIFVDSLKTHSNVCQGCFKALYTLAFRTALSEGAPMIVTGLSRGQFFETRLTPDLFRSSAPTCAQLDAMVTQARKTYHAEDDALSRLLETQDLQDGQFLDQIQVLDIYRYTDVPVSDIYNFLKMRTAWVRPDDTGRSTNCLINDVGIHLHKAREGFHNYALPYSWDVRMGHKTRAQALDELNDEIDEQKVSQILDEIGFDEPLDRPPTLTVYVAGRNLRESDVWEMLAAHFQREMLPDSVVILDEMPLTTNGKVDNARLPKGSRRTAEDTVIVAPSSAMEHHLTKILSLILKKTQIGITQDFFDLGVDSLTAIQIAIRANEDGLPLPPSSVFEHRTVKALAAYAEGLATAEPDQDDSASLIDLDHEDLAAITQALR